MSIDQNQTELSIVCTVYNDDELVPILISEVKKYVDVLGINYEIILVNDSSSDNSEMEIEKACNRDKKIKGINLARNFGQQIAMSVGMRYATGKYVLIMDGDLQNPPSEIPLLYHEILNGFDIVYTVSKTRNDLFDKWTSMFFWFIVSKILKVSVVKNQLMMKIMTSDFVKRYNTYQEINRTVAGIVRDISSNYQVMYIENTKRTIGKSHYTIFKRFNLLIDIIISLSNAPLNMMIYFGLLVFIVTIIISFYYLFLYLFYDVPPGFTSIILAVFFFGSLIVLLLGFIGRYLSNIYSEVRRRPLYHLKSLYNILN